MTLHSRNRTAASTKLALQAPLDICSQMPSKVGYDDRHESIVIAILRQAVKVAGEDGGWKWPGTPTSTWD